MFRIDADVLGCRKVLLGDGHAERRLCGEGDLAARQRESGCQAHPRGDRSGFGEQMGENGEEVLGAWL